MQLHLDHTGLDIRAEQHEVAAIGLNRRPHQLDDRLQRGEALASLLIGHGDRGWRLVGCAHGILQGLVVDSDAASPSLPCRAWSWCARLLRPTEQQ